MTSYPAWLLQVSCKKKLFRTHTKKDLMKVNLLVWVNHQVDKLVYLHLHLLWHQWASQNRLVCFHRPHLHLHQVLIFRYLLHLRLHLWQVWPYRLRQIFRLWRLLLFCWRLPHCWHLLLYWALLLRWLLHRRVAMTDVNIIWYSQSAKVVEQPQPDVAAQEDCDQVDFCLA